MFQKQRLPSYLLSILKILQENPFYLFKSFEEAAGLFRIFSNRYTSLIFISSKVFTRQSQKFIIQYYIHYYTTLLFLQDYFQQEYLLLLQRWGVALPAMLYFSWTSSNRSVRSQLLRAENSCCSRVVSARPSCRSRQRCRAMLVWLMVLYGLSSWICSISACFRPRWLTTRVHSAPSRAATYIRPTSDKISEVITDKYDCNGENDFK